MTLVKAVEILNINVQQRNQQMPPDVLEALKLGTEALAAILKLRQGIPALDLSLLPGETEDD